MAAEQRIGNGTLWSALRTRRGFALVTEHLLRPTKNLMVTTMSWHANNTHNDDDLVTADEARCRATWALAARATAARRPGDATRRPQRWRRAACSRLARTRHPGAHRVRVRWPRARLPIADAPPRSHPSI